MKRMPQCYAYNLMKCRKCHLRQFSPTDLNLSFTFTSNRCFLFIFDLINAYETCPKLINSGFLMILLLVWFLNVQFIFYVALFQYSYKIMGFGINDYDDNVLICAVSGRTFAFFSVQMSHSTKSNDFMCKLFI